MQDVIEKLEAILEELKSWESNGYEPRPYTESVIEISTQKMYDVIFK